jgi:hypothetical protein
MTMFRHYLRSIAALPALLLAVMLLAQVEGAAHLHGADDAGEECFQCQHHGTEGGPPADNDAPPAIAGRDTPESPPVHALALCHYRLQARGPPAFS